MRNNARHFRDRSSGKPRPEHAHIAQAVPAVLSALEQAPPTTQKWFDVNDSVRVLQAALADASLGCC